MGAADVLVRVTAWLAVCWLVAAVCRRTSASLRALMWTLALAGVLLLPIAWSLVPVWRIEVLQPVPVSEASPAGAGPAQGTARGLARARRGAPAPPTATGASAVVAASHQPPIPASASAPASVSAPAPAPALASAPASAPTPALPWPAVFVVVWAMGAAWLTMRIVASHVRLAGIARRARPFDRDLTSPEMPGDSAALRVRVTDEVAVPAVAGLIRPVLLLPPDAGEWTPEVTRAVLRHEMAHIRRRDAIGHAIGRIACAAYWCVPLVWPAARRAAALREQACDDEVLRSGVAASAYASSLIHLAQHAGCAPLQSAALAMAAPPSLQERVMTILNPSVPRTVVSVRASCAIALAVAAAVTLVAAVEPAPRAVGGVAGAPRLQPAAPGPVQTPAQASASRPCGGDLDSSSSSINENNGRRTWTIKLRGSRCTVDFRLDGKVEFNDDFTDVASLSSGGSLRLDVTDAGVRRQLDLASQGGTIARTWRVDGREQPYDDAARAWFGAFLIELDRRTAVGVEQRLPRLLRQGGVNAVLAETGLMRSDYARSVYYSKLAAATRLSSGDVARVLDQAGSLKTSDYYAAELITHLAASTGDDAGVRAAMFRLIQAMKSDFYRTEAARAAVGSGRLGAREMDLLVDLVPRMESDYYKTELLKQIVRAGRLEADQRTALARLARDIHEDFYAAEFIKALAEGGDVGRGGAQALIAAASTIQSDFYLSEAFASLTAHITLEEADLLAMTQAAGRTSDFYKSEILRRILRQRAATPRVRQAVVDASAGMSRSYRDEVRRAAGIG